MTTSSVLPIDDSAANQSESTSVELTEKISYRVHYFESPEKLLESVLNKTVVPYQVEVQPGRLNGGALCWMSCPYCYGGSSDNTTDRLDPARYVEILRQTAAGPHGGVNKLIFAGYATDPLNYQHIDDLFDVARENKQIIGVHSKLLRLSDRTLETLTDPENKEDCYLTVSVDAGSASGYNLTHALPAGAKVYAKVLENITRMAARRNERGSTLSLSANYLITRVNNSVKEIEKAVQDLITCGVDSIRFSFPQLPRGFDSDKDGIVPSRNEVIEYYSRLKPIIESYSGETTSIMLMDYDGEKRITDWQTLPCFARYIYPAVSFDGHLSNCSQSAAPHFKNMSLGDLRHHDFWDAFYSYDTSNFRNFLDTQHKHMKANDCRCDRKEHTVNGMMKEAFGADLEKIDAAVR